MNDSVANNDAQAPDKVYTSIPSLLDTLHQSFCLDKTAINSYNTSLDQYEETFTGLSRGVKRAASPPTLSKEDQQDSAVELRDTGNESVAVELKGIEDGMDMEENVIPIVKEIQQEATMDTPIFEEKKDVGNKSAVIERAFSRLKPQTRDVEVQARLDVRVSIIHFKKESVSMEFTSIAANRIQVTTANTEGVSLAEFPQIVKLLGIPKYCTNILYGKCGGGDMITHDQFSRFVSPRFVYS
jgi:hypothetical protein